MPGTRVTSVGRWGHGRSEDRYSQLGSGDDHREARLIPRGTGATREGGSLWDGVACPEADSRPHGRRAPKRAPVAQLGNRASCLLLEEGGAGPGGLAPDRITWKTTSIPRIKVVLEARGLLPSETSSGGNGIQVWTTWKLCRSRRGARRRSVSTPVATRRHHDQVCVFDAPEGAPHRIAPIALPDIRPKTNGSPTRHSPGRTR